MSRGAKRFKPDFDYAERARAKNPAIGTGAYSKLWNIIDGGVKDALGSHPDYLTPKGARSARTSIVKRVTGTVIGFAEQSAKGRGNSAETEDRPAPDDPPATVVYDADAGAGAVSSSAPLDPHCRIGRIRFKRRSRYRSPSAFDIKTDQLRRALRQSPMAGE